MTLKIMFDEKAGVACLYDSALDKPFGVVVYNRPAKNGKEALTAYEVLEKFLAWSTLDPRDLTVVQLELHFAAFTEWMEMDITQELIGKPNK